MSKNQRINNRFPPFPPFFFSFPLPPLFLSLFFLRYFIFWTKFSPVNPVVITLLRSLRKFWGSLLQRSEPTLQRWFWTLFLKKGNNQVPPEIFLKKILFFFSLKCAANMIFWFIPEKVLLSFLCEPKLEDKKFPLFPHFSFSPLISLFPSLFSFSFGRNNIIFFLQKCCLVSYVSQNQWIKSNIHLSFYPFSSFYPFLGA